MNICLFTTLYRSETCVDKGIGNYFADLAHALSVFGHNVHVLIITLGANEQTQEFMEGAVHIHVFNIKLPALIDIGVVGKALYILSYLYAVWRAKKAIVCLTKKYSIDIIETTSLNYVSIGYLLGKRRPPVITRIFTTWQQTLKCYKKAFSKRDKLSFWLERLVVKYSDYLVTHTVAHRDKVSRELGIDPKLFKIIPLGIELPDISGVNVQRRTNDKINILYVGRFQPRKGIDILLKAIP
ncbi:unnamed protein product, partial [marine sediment metagenome]